jgi:hypothetical protein
MKIEITQEDIQQGERCDPYNCPVALALRRTGFPNCSVLTICFRPDRRTLSRFKWPSEVTDWIRNHDDFGNGQPATFEFNWPEKP